MTKKPPFILVDGSSYLFRAYHALPPLANSRGEPTGAIVGVVNMLRKLIDEYKPEFIGIVFDTPGKTFRDDMYPEYKANRSPTPDDLVAQIAPLYDIIRAMGLPILLEQGVEADDVIGTLATQASKLGMATIISTGDKDMAQLVDDHVGLINTMSETSMDAQGVMNKFGVRPDQIIDYLALMGDSVDNIPGVPKCGPKTAAKWLAEYDTLDAVMAHADEFKGKIGESLRATLPQLPLSRELTTIKIDLDLAQGPTDLVPMAPNRQQLRELYGRIEARRLLASVDEVDDVAAAPVIDAIETEYETVLDEARFLQWLARLRQAELFAFDTETTGLDYMQAEIVGVSFAVEAGKAAYVPVAHCYPGAPDQLSREWVLTHLKPLLEDAARDKVGQNLKYDMSVLARYDIHLRGIRFDTMLESYVFNATGSRHDMDTLALKYLGLKTVHFEDIAGKGKKQITFDQVALEEAGPYAAEDADITLRLHQVLWSKLAETPSLIQVLEEIELPLVPVLSKIERNGILIDTRMLQLQSHDLATRLHKLEQQAYDIAGRNFNLASPKQIGQIFFEELQLPVKAKTPKGVPSTAESVLVELAEEGHELPTVILEHRGLAKLRSTYVDKLPNMVNPADGRVHTSYHQAVAATGRLSSSDPNLQNIPVRSEDGRKIRQAFVPADGYIMLAADYSQIELRIMAHLSEDSGLLQAFEQGLDIHRATAAEVFAGGDLEAVTDNQRRSAKAINFGLIYGMSAFGLAKQLGIGRKEAQDYVNLYFGRYPGVLDFMEKTRAAAHDQGYVETLFGRRLYLPEINARNKMRQAAAERTAINAPMQGTAADIIKKAMISIHGWIERESPPLKMLMQVHDELVFEVEEGALADMQPIIVSYMESAAVLKVPLLVEAGVGANWEAAH